VPAAAAWQQPTGGNHLWQLQVLGHGHGVHMPGSTTAALVYRRLLQQPECLWLHSQHISGSDCNSCCNSPSVCGCIHSTSAALVASACCNSPSVCGCIHSTSAALSASACCNSSSVCGCIHSTSAGLVASPAAAAGVLWSDDTTVTPAACLGCDPAWEAIPCHRSKFTTNRLGLAVLCRPWPGRHLQGRQCVWLAREGLATGDSAPHTSGRGVMGMCAHLL
jgi:hypothetical protein